jgi:hypothetical protein
MKKLCFFILLILFSTNVVHAEEKKDCKGKKLINKLWCKSTSLKGKDLKGINLKPDLNKFSESKTIADLFRKKN